MRDVVASLLRFPSSRPRPPITLRLMSSRLLLQISDTADWKQWRALRDASRDYLMPWEPKWPDDALSYGFYCSLLRRQWREWRAGTGFAFSIFRHEEQQTPYLVGGITLSNVHYASAQKGTIGYWTAKPYAGHGYMTESVGLVCDFAFDTLRLQRVEASCMPTNEASKAVLNKSGFEQEGFAKAYLQINGVREDHLLWGLNRENRPKPTQP